jgi:hypothetical protein
MKPVLWAVAAMALVAAICGGLWWQADRAWLSPPEPGFWRLAVRVDGMDYREGLATELMLDLAMFSDRGNRAEVGAAKRPRHMRVWHDFARKGGDDSAEMLRSARVLIAQRMRLKGFRWRVALIDEEGNAVSAGAAPGDR